MNPFPAWSVKLAAAKGNDAYGGIGVCPNCSIMPIRILSESGYSRYGADSDAFRWAVDNGAQILSNSWGTIEPSQIPPNLADAIVYAADTARDGKGAVVLFAAGNDSRENEPYELASHPMVLGQNQKNTIIVIHMLGIPMVIMLPKA